MNKRVLITGGAGFIGSHLVRRFAADGYKVRILDSLETQIHGSAPEYSSQVQELENFAEVLIGSVTSPDSLREALIDADLVVHLAAETGTGQSMYEIDRYVETNVGGVAKLLDILTNEDHNVKRLVIASSRSVYGEGSYLTTDGRVVHPSHRTDEDMSRGDFEVHLSGEGSLSVTPTDENAKLHPSSVYGITKQMQESLIMTVAPAIGLEAVSLRYQNVYGPGQSLQNPYTGILSIFSTLIREGKEINIFEDGLESRDFVYIDDVVEATFRASVLPGISGSTINVGSGKSVTVAEVVDSLIDAFGIKVPTRVSGQYRLGDIRHNVADVSRLRELLGIESTVSFDEGIKSFASWVLAQPLASTGYEKSLQEMIDRKLLK